MNSFHKRLTPEQKQRIIQHARENPSEAHLKYLEKTAASRALYIELSQPVVNELRQAGYNVKHIEDLYQRYSTYKSAIPILLKWLPRIIHSDVFKALSVRKTILHALNNKCAKPEAIRPLIQEFENFKKFEGVRDDRNVAYHWTIGNVLSALADDSLADDLFRIVSNKDYGAARAMLVRGLKNLKDPRTVDVLISLIVDNDIVECAIYALGMLRAKKARPYIEKFLNDPTTSIRQEAKAAIKRIDKNKK